MAVLLCGCCCCSLSAWVSKPYGEVACNFHPETESAPAGEVHETVDQWIHHRHFLVELGVRTGEAKAEVVVVAYVSGMSCHS